MNLALWSNYSVIRAPKICQSPVMPFSVSFDAHFGKAEENPDNVQPIFHLTPCIAPRVAGLL